MNTATTRRPNFRTLDLNLLKVFDVVMTERHVTRAAEQLAMTQPAVSNALRRLRESVQEELFVPGSGGVTPTATALALWPTVRASLRSLQAVLAPKAFDATNDERQFSVAMADATAALFAPALADALAREQAQVGLSVTALTTRDPRSVLERSEADVAVGFFPEAHAAVLAESPHSALASEPLYTCRYVGVMRRGHPLAKAHALTLDAYCSARHLRVNFAGRPRGFVDAELERRGRERRVVMSVSHFATAVAVVRQSDVLTVLPRSYVPASGFADDLVMRELPFPMPPIEVRMLWHRRHEQDLAHQWLRKTLADAAARVAAALADVMEPFAG